MSHPAAPARPPRMLPALALLAVLMPIAAAAQDSAGAPDPGRAPGSPEDITRAHGIAIFGEPALAAGFTHLPYANPDAPKGGYISQSVPNSSNFDNFNPYTLKGRPAALATVMLETLLEQDADQFGSDYCLLCETLEYPASRDWVIFHLRPEARFADGRPLTAQDVAFSVETLREQASSGLKLMVRQQIAKVEALDAERVKFYFAEGYPRREVIQFAGHLPVFSRADFQDRELRLDETMDAPLMGSGPYALTGWSMGRWVEATRREDYWGAALPINRGRYNFDRLRYEYFADYDSAFQAFTAGEYSFRHEVSSIKWATAYDFPALEKGWVKQVTLPDDSSVSGQAWAFNLRRPQLQDARVRQAIGLMFNFKWTNEKQFYGLYARVNSFWENSPLEATGLPSEAELALLEPLREHLPEAVFTEPAFVWPEGSDRPRDRAAMRKASALLDEAGWTIGQDGLRRNQSGEVLKIDILNDSATFDRIINPFVENLRAIGVDARNMRIDNAETVARERAHDFDITSGFYGQSPIPGAELLRDFGSEYAGSETAAFGLQNPAIDALIKHVEGAQTRDELLTATHALDRSLRALQIWIPQWYNPSYLLAYRDVYGHPEMPPKHALGEMSLWWWDAEKAEKLREAGALR